MRKKMIAGIGMVLMAGIAFAPLALLSGVVLENDAFRLVVGDDARARSLVVKATGEETLDNGEGLPLFSVTQERPFNNEIKLMWPNKRTTYPANRLRREGDRLVVGFETAPYEAVVGVKAGGGYVAFELEGFNCVRELDYEVPASTPIPESTWPVMPARRTRSDRRRTRLDGRIPYRRF